MKDQWTFEAKTSALGDTGDYESSVIFTNGKEILQTNGDDMSEEDCETFVDLLNLMPDLWSHSLDAAQFELSQLPKPPSDDEIYDHWKRKQCTGNYLEGLVDGSKWMREKLHISIKP